MRIRYLSCFVLAVVVAGCGQSGPEVAPVSGHVTVDGKPMENVNVVFQPVDARSPSYGQTDKDGRYALGYKRGVQGALVGSHNVGISVSAEVVRNAPHIKNTQLRREVKSGSNEFDFDVTSESK
jgi:hypothetical protein